MKTTVMLMVVSLMVLTLVYGVLFGEKGLSRGTDGRVIARVDEGLYKNVSMPALGSKVEIYPGKSGVVTGYWGSGDPIVR